MNSHETMAVFAGRYSSSRWTVVGVAAALLYTGRSVSFLKMWWVISLAFSAIC